MIRALIARLLRRPNPAETRQALRERAQATVAAARAARERYEAMGRPDGRG